MAGASSDSIHVLHVDDEADFGELTAKFVEREDERLKFETASSVSEGLDWLSQAEFDCVVSDLDMPKRNGIEFLEAVRQDFPDLPFILFTGKGSEEVASEAISAGVTDYLQKESGTDQYAVLANRIRNAVEATRFAHSAGQRQHRLEQILKTVPGCVVRIDYDGQFVFANQRAEEVLGLEPADVAERTYNDPEWMITDLEGQPIPDEQLPFRQVRDSGEPIYGYRHMVEWPDGTRKALQVNGAPLFDGEGNVQSTVFALIDITEQVEREREIRETSRRLSLALEATETGVWEWNMETNEVVWNTSLEQLLGIEPGTFEGTFEAHEEYLHPDDIDEVERAVERALEDGTFTAEFRMIREDGERIWVRGLGEYFDDDGSERIIGTTTDITEQKEREQELREQNERLEEFASIVSHDLRSPLRVAEGQLELAYEERDWELLDPVVQAHDRMDALIEDVLSLSHAGADLGETEPVELASLVERCWRNVETDTAMLVVDAEKTIQADQSRVQQLLENLLRNAIEHGGSEVTVRVGDLSRGFYVEDDGAGIPEAERANVFDPGYSTDEDGTGFGLSIVRDIAEAHEWEISVTESSDGGARFEFIGIEAA